MTEPPTESDSEVPENRCGYTFPEDSDIEKDPDYIPQRNSCIRHSLPDTDRCAVHADPAETEHKREQLADTDSVGGSLDGAVLPDSFADSVDFLEISLLRDADLSEADLYMADLSGADLIEADLSGARLDGADLSGAVSNEADLSEAHLSKADLSGAVLFDADLSGADLIEADLSGARLDGADLSGAELFGADLSRATLSGVATLSGADLSGATLRRVDLSGARLPGVDLSESPLCNANFAGATLDEADLREADLEDAQFDNADLREATLARADCEEATFVEANLNRATFENADLSGANLSQAYLYQTRLDGVQINNQTQVSTGGDIGDTDTENACRYDSGSSPVSSSEAIDQSTVDEDTNQAVARARRARSVYSRLEELARENGFPDFKSEMFVRRQDARRELLRAQGRWLRAGFAQLQKTLFEYGESFSRIVSFSGLIIGF